MSVSPLLTTPLHLTHKWTRSSLQHTSIRSAATTLTHKATHQWVSGRRLPWQHIQSRVAAWSIRDVMLLNQPPSALRRGAIIWKRKNGTIQASSTSLPFLACRKRKRWNSSWFCVEMLLLSNYLYWCALMCFLINLKKTNSQTVNDWLANNLSIKKRERERQYNIRINISVGFM